MPEQDPVACPHFGGSNAYCFAQTPPAVMADEHRDAYCLTPSHTRCPYYWPIAHKEQAAPAETETDESEYLEYAAERQPASRWLRLAPWLVVILLALVAAFVYGRDLLGATAPAPVASAVVTSATPATATVPSLSATSTPAARRNTPTTGARPAALATNARFASPTPEAGGQTLSLQPEAGDVGWWSSNDLRATHLGDSLLYAGYFEAQAFVSAMRWNVSRVPRGAPIRSATLILTGLNAERFSPKAGGTWTLQLLALEGIEDLSKLGFQALFNAPAAITLLPSLTPDDLAANQPNRWSLDAGALDWLAKQIADGATHVTLRIVGPATGQDTLFAWDSGAGPMTAGNAPQLVLGLGPAPVTPPPLPTKEVIVAELPPTPANVLTVAAEAFRATAIAETTGTYTPTPDNLVTPTPFAANLATVQAIAAARGLPPVILHTPTPANAATAAAYDALATAIAITTGTYTPAPTDAVTPAIVVLSPTPQNVLTAAAHVVDATAQAAIGTPTPLPYNALLATPSGAPAPFSTPTPDAITAALEWNSRRGPLPLILHTPTPANPATATLQALYATAVALTTGTFTPAPTDAITPMIITPTPMPENVATAAAQLLAGAPAEGGAEPSPLPYNVLVATVTPTPFLVTATPRPANAATAAAQSIYATAVALTTGTFTPLPPNAVTPTPLPLLLYLNSLTPTPRPTPSPTWPTSPPAILRGKVLFLSDRDGETKLFALDPANGRLAYLTQPWPYDQAAATQARAPDGSRLATVAPDSRRVAQIFIKDPNAEAPKQLTTLAGLCSDPSWSPAGDRIAFASLDPGNDEIYTISPAGDALRRLTNNAWEMDRHPSWSPDGTQIVFWSNRGDGRRQLWVMNADGGDQRPLLESPFNDWDPLWVR